MSPEKPSPKKETATTRSATEMAVSAFGDPVSEAEIERLKPLMEGVDALSSIEEIFYALGDRDPGDVLAGLDRVIAEQLETLPESYKTAWEQILDTTDALESLPAESSGNEAEEAYRQELLADKERLLAEPASKGVLMALAGLTALRRKCQSNLRQDYSEQNPLSVSHITEDVFGEPLIESDIVNHQKTAFIDRYVIRREAWEDVGVQTVTSIESSQFVTPEYYVHPNSPYQFIREAEPATQAKAVTLANWDSYLDGIHELIPLTNPIDNVKEVLKELLPLAADQQDRIIETYLEQKDQDNFLITLLDAHHPYLIYDLKLAQLNTRTTTRIDPTAVWEEGGKLFGIMEKQLLALRDTLVSQGLYAEGDTLRNWAETFSSLYKSKLKQATQALVLARTLGPEAEAKLGSLFLLLPPSSYSDLRTYFVQIYGEDRVAAAEAELHNAKSD